MARRTGQKLLRFDRNLGVRRVAGCDEAGRGSLAGPLVVAGVLLDYECLRDHRVRPLALLNDSKQLPATLREELFHAVVASAARVSVHLFPPQVIDRDGLHRTNLRGLREALWACQPADACLVDGFRLGGPAPPQRAFVDGDEKSAAIAAASIVAKVTRDRYMRRADALYPHFGFSPHVGSITPTHPRAPPPPGALGCRPRPRPVRDPPALVPGALLPALSFRHASERRAMLHYALRGYR